MTIARAAATLWCVALTLGAAPPASGQMTGAPTAGYKQEPGMPAGAMPLPLREIGFDQRINERLPLDAVYTHPSVASPDAAAITSEPDDAA